MKTWLIALSVCWLGMAVPAAAQLPLDPQPRKVVQKQGVFNLKKKTYIFADDSCSPHFTRLLPEKFG